MGVPYVISIWALPKWLYENPPRRARQSRRRIDPDKWDELLECLGSYLEYAKRTYGVEPDLFSFNEANIGVDVLLTAEEHREAIKRIGAHFSKLGLKTRMLLADATGPRGTHTYALPAANDPEALKYCGAIGFHSWGGAQPEQYAAWGDLAKRLKLPLLVAELGVDAGAWRTKAFDSYHYAMREVRMYQELLLHARPQGTMQWEFTSDYGIAKAKKVGAGKVEVVPGVRFYFVKHFCNLTPQGADALATSSDNAKVLFTALRGEDDGEPAYTLHVANLGPARVATIAGIPASVELLRAVRTSEKEHFQELAAAQPDKGTIKLELAAQSLLTLTTRD
jgi:O-glycosyl hydrolase